MAELHNTTMTPSKLELLARWLPGQSWFRGASDARLTKAGGFRLDDPAGRVGIEFFVVAASAAAEGADQQSVFLAPLTYRDAPLAEADEALIGIAEHGVLGRRWVYDGVRDPALVGALFELLAGRAEPQSQNVSGTTDPSVVVRVGELRGLAVTRFSPVPSTTDDPETLVQAVDPATTVTRQVGIRFVRRLSPGGDNDAYRSALGAVTGGWVLPDGTAQRGTVVLVRDVAADAADNLSGPPA